MTPRVPSSVGRAAALLAAMHLVFATGATTQSNGTPQPPACAASASWVSAPNPPQEIPNGGTDFCDFYQFA